MKSWASARGSGDCSCVDGRGIGGRGDQDRPDGAVHRRLVLHGRQHARRREARGERDQQGGRRARPAPPIGRARRRGQERGRRAGHAGAHQQGGRRRQSRLRQHGRGARLHPLLPGSRDPGDRQRRDGQHRHPAVPAAGQQGQLRLPQRRQRHDPEQHDRGGGDQAPGLQEAGDPGGFDELRSARPEGPRPPSWRRWTSSRSPPRSSTSATPT